MLALAAQRTDPAELDSATLRCAIANDAAATRTLVELYQTRVFALVSRMLVGRLGADRAAAIRGDSFGVRREMNGCPDPAK